MPVRKFLGLLTRSKDEPFIHEFCEYYLSQGVDHIYIADDNSHDKTIYQPLTHNPAVTIIYTKDLFVPFDSRIAKLNALCIQVMHQYEWFINVDADEYITTRARPSHTIRQELATTFARCARVAIPWVMMAFNGREHNPRSVLLENTYRANHDKRHPPPKGAPFKNRCHYDSTFVKSIFKPSMFSGVTVHFPVGGKPNAVTLDGITAQPLVRHARPDMRSGVREHDIQNAHLVCYHYRIASVDQCRKKSAWSADYKLLRVEFDNMLAMDHPELQDNTLALKAGRIPSIVQKLRQP
jgi:hypothetical protein